MRAKDSINITLVSPPTPVSLPVSPMSGFGIWYEGPLDLDWTPLALIWRIVATPACHSTLMIVVGLVPRSLPGQTYPDWLQWQSIYGTDCKKRLVSIIIDLFEKSIFYSLMSWRFQLKGWSWLLHARVPLNKANLWYKSENRRSLPAHSFDPLGRLQARRENRAAPWLH